MATVEFPAVALAAAALELSKEAVVGIEDGQRVALYNRAAVELFGPPPSEAEFPGWEDRCGFHYPGGVGSSPCSKADLPWRRALRNELPDSTPYLIRNHLHPASIPALVSGCERGSRAVISVRADASLSAHSFQLEKMAAVRRLAGVVAHDSNNLLTIVSGYGQLMSDALVRGLPLERITTYLDELVAAADRSSVLTGHLLAFSGKRTARPRRFDLGVSVQSMHAELRALAGPDVGLSVEVGHEPCFVRADPERIAAVILSMALNAREAVADGGHIVVRVSCARGVPPFLGGRECVQLEIEDNGAGMNEAALGRVFEPFFTSKPKGDSLGLSLALAYAAIAQAGGDVTVYSEPDVGSLFRIYFPFSAAADAAFPAASASPRA